VAGKTGTAQWKRKATDHAWFAGFAPAGDGRQVAFAVVVVEGGGGGRTAAPIAGQIVAAVRK
jgi:peptidoglycan glycosyltransferase